MPLISVIIATLQDDGDLLLCLDSLARQGDAPPFEVIIVDQNGDDRLDALVAAYAGHFPLTHLRLDVRCANRARNLGAHHAKGVWLGFPDDDCILLPDNLMRVARLAAGGRLKIISGRTVDEQGRSNILPWRSADCAITRWSMFRCITEATLFMTRSTFLSIGGFDEQFGPGARYPAAEGLELIARALIDLRPDETLYTPALTMQHPTKIPPWTRTAVRQFHHYGLGVGALAAKHRHFNLLCFWALRMARAAIRLPSRDRWRGRAYLAFLAGLIVGTTTYRRTKTSCSG